jgi:hypothetical protein
MALLADHRARRLRIRADADELALTAPPGGPLDYAQFRRRIWALATAAAGLHDLRRATATALVLDRVDLKPS